MTPSEVFVAEPSPVLAPTEPYEAMGVRDPELVWDGSNLFLFYTARDESGAGSIRVAWVSESLAQFSKGEAPVFAPTGDVVSYDAPTVVYRDGLWLLVARAAFSSGATELHAFYTSDPDTGWARVVNGGLEQLTRVEDATSEITDPSLIVHNSAYQLYYARRTGTRWSVELAVSDELLLWRPMGEVLGGSDEASTASARGAPTRFRGRTESTSCTPGKTGLLSGSAPPLAPPPRTRHRASFDTAPLGADVEVMASSETEPPPADPSRKARRRSTAFIAAFVVLQFLIPLTYLTREDAADERFTWRSLRAGGAHL